MKKIVLFVLFLISLNSYSQSTLISKKEKISYSEYDDLKYIQSIVKNFSYNESINRFYEDGETLITSSLNHSDKNRATVFYSTGTIEFSIFGSSVVKGVLKKDGANRFLTLTECNAQKCDYYMFVNNERVYKGSADIIKQ